jgi:hypothetical protein
MPIYYMLLDAMLFHWQIIPALTTSWRERSFHPCRPLRAALLASARSYVQRFHLRSEETLLCTDLGALSFDRHCWQALVGEILVFAAAEIPELQVAPALLRRLLAPERGGPDEVPREQFAPIDQAHFGSRYLCFGRRIYRAEHAGYNDSRDVARLNLYLDSQDPARWSLSELMSAQGAENIDDLKEELEFARDWFPSLQEIYRAAHRLGQVVVCEAP